jgi:flagellar biosynthesis/type III secretory pathway ATPase
VDVLNSQSRLFTQIASPEHRAQVSFLRRVMATYQQARDLIDVGAYVNGSNPEIDRAIALWPKVQRFLRQVPEERSNFGEVLAALKQLAS